MISKNIGRYLLQRQLMLKGALTYNPKIFSFAVDATKQRRFQQIRKHTTMSQYPNLKPKIRQHLNNQVKLIQDKQTGLRFLVQKSGFAGCCDMGICLKLGTQDETKDNAGSLQYLKSFVHMKPSFEQLVGNYQILTQTGSTFDLNYDSMTTYAKCSFLQQDQDLMIDLLLDLVLQEKNMFEDNHATEIDYSNINDLVRRTAFGNSGLGMPPRGIGNTLTNAQFLKFQQKITPKNMIISISNISNPEKFIEKVKEKIKLKYPKFLQRQPQPTPKSKYIGGLGRYDTQNQFFQFAVAFPAAHSKSQHMELYNILRVLLGSASSFSSGGPGKGMHSRCTKYLLNQVNSVQKASYINEHYDQFGLFGLSVGGDPANWEQLLNCTLHQLAKLTQIISQQQLDRAKHILISSIYQNIQRQSDRLQQLTKHIFYYDKIKLQEFERNIRKVTAEDIQTEMTKLFSQKPTFVYSVNQKNLKLPTQKELLNGFQSYIEAVNKE